MDIDAYRARKAAYARTPEQRQKRNAYMRVWREKNRDKHNRQARESHQRNKYKHVEQNRNQRLVTIYGITTVEKRAMVERQEGRCAICRKELRIPHVDHCHETKKIRGILCFGCNTRLGWYESFRDRIGIYLHG